MEDKKQEIGFLLYLASELKEKGLEGTQAYAKIKKKIEKIAEEIADG